MSATADTIEASACGDKSSCGDENAATGSAKKRRKRATIEKTLDKDELLKGIQSILQGGSFLEPGNDTSDASKMLSQKDIELNGLDDFAGFKFTGALRPFRRMPKMPPPEGSSLPDYATHPDGVARSELIARRKRVIPVLEGGDLETMREVCRLGREVLDIAGKAVRVGITGDEIDRIVWQACTERKLYPSPLGYSGFPKSVCVSPNEVICHGIPDCRPFEEGDIVNLDVSVYYDGFHSDLNEMFFVGKCSEDSHNLVRASYEALQAAAKMIRPGTMYRELGAHIHEVAMKAGCVSVPDFCGHGVGKLFHGPPDVPHYRRNKAIGTMKPGHVFTVEPMLNIGKSSRATCWPDGWTQVTTSGKRSAQFEHTFLVTETGYEVLTARVGTDRSCMPDYEASTYQR
jgi:methionyl aminopeptidase